MRPFVNLPEDDRVTDIGNMHKKLDKDRACGSGDILADRQTDTQTDILITILRNFVISVSAHGHPDCVRVLGRYISQTHRTASPFKNEQHKTTLQLIGRCGRSAKTHLAPTLEIRRASAAANHQSHNIILPTILVVQAEKSVGCVCLSVCPDNNV